MSERGVYAIDRGIWGHEAFADEPFTEREAWMWLISEAAWGERKKRTDGKVIDLQRGQLCHAIRFMAQAWDWSKSRVERFLVRLENQDMIRRDHGTRTPVVTICNYDKFQKVSLPNRDKDETTSGTTAGQQRDKLENNKNIKEDTCAEIRPQKPRGDYSAEFEAAWQGYPRRDGGNPKAPAAKLFLAAVKAGEDPQAIIDGAKRFAAAEARNVGTPYIPQMVKWLRDKRWLDYGTGHSATIFNIRSSLV